LHGAGAQAPKSARKAVLIELFTPRAALLALRPMNYSAIFAQEKFCDGLDIIPLALHVDYWNPKDGKTASPLLITPSDNRNMRRSLV